MNRIGLDGSTGWSAAGRRWRQTTSLPHSRRSTEARAAISSGTFFRPGPHLSLYSGMQDLATAAPRRTRLILPAAIALFILGAIARVYSADAIFTQTYDEPFHIASGMEWLDRGTYTFE